jgi:hypothetical protein
MSPVYSSRVFRPLCYVKSKRVLAGLKLLEVAVVYFIDCWRASLGSYIIDTNWELISEISNKSSFIFFMNFYCYVSVPKEHKVNVYPEDCVHPSQRYASVINEIILTAFKFA